jgi:hypothetical protein
MSVEEEEEEGECARRTSIKKLALRVHVGEVVE